MEDYISLSRSLSFFFLSLFFCLSLSISEAWGPPQFQEKRSRSERAILGALGEFRGILGAALGIGNSILGIRNSILGMASHDLINTKPTILGATLGAIPGIAANPPERFSFAPAFSERFFKNWGGPSRTLSLTSLLSISLSLCLSPYATAFFPRPLLSLTLTHSLTHSLSLSLGLFCSLSLYLSITLEFSHATITSEGVSAPEQGPQCTAWNMLDALRWNAPGCTYGWHTIAVLILLAQPLCRSVSGGFCCIN